LLHDSYLFNDSFNFNHLVSDISHWDNLFLFNLNFPNFLYYFGNFHNLLYEFLNVLVDLDYLGDDSLNFDDFRDFD
jgi:hypothetical protein